MASNSTNSSAPGHVVPENITLRIIILAHGNRAEDDLFLVLSLNTTIAQLKQRIQESLSQHPVPENQRLIYQGRPLLDSTTPLRQILRVEQRAGSSSHVIHLVIRDAVTDTGTPPPLPASIPQHAAPTQPTPRAMPGGQNAHMAIHNQLHNMQHQLHHAQALRAGQARAQPQHAVNQTTPAVSNHATAAGLPPPNLPAMGATGPTHPGLHPQMPSLSTMTRIEDRIGPNGERMRTVTDSNGNTTSTTMVFRIPGLNPSDPIDRPSSAPGSSPLARPDQVDRAVSALPQNIHVHAQGPPHVPAGFPHPPGMQLPPPLPSMFLPNVQHAPLPPPPQPPQTMAWLLNSPSGPKAVVFAPGHGFFNTLPSHPQGQSVVLTPTTTAPLAAHQPLSTSDPSHPPTQAQLVTRSQDGSTETTRNDTPAPPQPGAVPQTPRPAPAPAPAVLAQRRHERLQDHELVQIILSRGWLFMRLYMFIFVLSESGTWRRMILLTSAILYCLLPRNNPLTSAFEIARRHFDGLIGPPVIPERRPQPPGPAQPLPPQHTDANPRPTPTIPHGQATPTAGTSLGRVTAPLPTPEEAARRLLEQQNRRNPNPVIDMLFRIEQGLVLFLASLIPGLGERHVQAREQARRILDEEERRVRERREAEEQSRQLSGQAAAPVTDTQNDEEVAKVEGGPLPTSWGSGSTNTNTNDHTASSSGINRHAGGEGEIRARGTGN